jgi:hypothetical protein
MIGGKERVRHLGRPFLVTVVGKALFLESGVCARRVAR